MTELLSGRTTGDLDLPPCEIAADTNKAYWVWLQFQVLGLTMTTSHSSPRPRLTTVGNKGWVASGDQPQ